MTISFKWLLVFFCIWFVVLTYQVIMLTNSGLKTRYYAYWAHEEAKAGLQIMKDAMGDEVFYERFNKAVIKLHRIIPGDETQ